MISHRGQISKIALAILVAAAFQSRPRVHPSGESHPHFPPKGSLKISANMTFGFFQNRRAKTVHALSRGASVEGLSIEWAWPHVVGFHAVLHGEGPGAGAQPSSSEPSSPGDGHHKGLL